MEELNKAIDEVISCIKDSKDYKKCLELKKQMDSNNEIKDLVEKVKSLQKKYIKSNYDDNIKVELESLEEMLNAIPIYVVYNQHLNKVNEDINSINSRLNDYFYNLFN